MLIVAAHVDGSGTIEAKGGAGGKHGPYTIARAGGGGEDFKFLADFGGGGAAITAVRAALNSSAGVCRFADK